MPTGGTVSQTIIMAPWYERAEEVGGMMVILSESSAEGPNVAANANAPKEPQKGEFDALIREVMNS